jgi:hypothetical protein
MRHLRPSFAAAALAAWLLTAPARADYVFTLTGTVNAVNDLSTVVSTGQQIHLLPEFAAGQAVTATGGFTADAQGNIQTYFLNIPGLISHLDMAGPSSSFDPANPGAGFRLSGGGFTSAHPAVVPHLAGADFDQLTAFLINGPSFTTTLHHSSLQLSNLDATLTATFSSVSVVPEPGGALLMAIGALGLVAYARGRGPAPARRGGPGPR